MSVKRDIFTQASCIAVQTVCDTLYGQKYHVLLDHAVENEPSLQKFKTKIFKTRKIWRETECSHFCSKLSRLWKRCEICSKLTIKTPERYPCRRSYVFIVNFELISPFSSVSIVDFEQVNVCWALLKFSMITNRF